MAGNGASASRRSTREAVQSMPARKRALPKIPALLRRCSTVTVDERVAERARVGRAYVRPDEVALPDLRADCVVAGRVMG